MERLAQYIILNPFSDDKIQPNSSDHLIIYRSGINPKIQRNFEVFSPCSFIARPPNTSRTKGSSSCAVTDGIPISCAASGSSGRRPGPWTCPKTRSSTSPHRGPAGSPQRSSTNSSRKSGKPTRSCAPTASTKCALLPSSTRLLSSNASCPTQIVAGWSAG